VSLTKEEILMDIGWNDEIKFKDLSDEFKNDHEIVIEAIKRDDSFTLTDLSDEQKSDREIVIALLEKEINSDSLSLIDDSWFSDKEFMSEALSIDSFFEACPDSVKGDKELVKIAIAINGYNLSYASEELQNDQELIFLSLEEDPRTLKGFNEDLRKNKDIVRKAVEMGHAKEEEANSDLMASLYRNIIQYAHKSLLEDEEFIESLSLKDYEKEEKDKIMKEVSKYGRKLMSASDEFKADKEVVMAAVQNAGEALEHASDELKADKEVVMAAIEDDARALEHASDELKANKEVVLAAASNNGHALEYASDELKADKEVVMAAVENEYMAFDYASEELRADKEVVMAAASNNGHALEYASDELKADKEVVMVAVSNAGHTLEYASDELKADKEVVMAAVSNADAGHTLEYASDELKADKEVVMAAVKNYYSSSGDRHCLEYASDELKADKEVVMAAVNNGGGYALQYASDELKADKEVVMVALDRNPWAVYKFDFISDVIDDSVLCEIKKNLCMPKNIDLDQIINDLKANPRHSPSLDAYYQDNADEQWSGLEYTQSDSTYEEFEDTILDFGIEEMQDKELYDSSCFGKGDVGIDLLYRDLEEISKPNPDGDIEEVQRIEVYQLTFSCRVILITVNFEFGAISDGEFGLCDRNLNFYCYVDGEDWHSHDPATFEHEYWDEMLYDIENEEYVEDDD